MGKRDRNPSNKNTGRINVFLILCIIIHTHAKSNLISLSTFIVMTVSTAVKKARENAIRRQGGIVSKHGSLVIANVMKQSHIICDRCVSLAMTLEFRVQISRLGKSAADKSVCLDVTEFRICRCFLH